MDSVKKHYTTPQLNVYGKLEEITQHGGTSAFDIPTGSDSAPPGGPGPVGKPYKGS